MVSLKLIPSYTYFLGGKKLTCMKQSQLKFWRFWRLSAHNKPREFSCPLQKPTKTWWNGVLFSRQTLSEQWEDAAGYYMSWVTEVANGLLVF